MPYVIRVPKLQSKNLRSRDKHITPNKNIDIKPSPHDVSLEKPLSGILKAIIRESQIM